MSEEKKFEFRAVKVFLTYPRSRLTKETLLAEGKKWGITQYVIGEEKHKDGHPHFHVYFKFEKELHTRNERHFDILGEHPNIKKIKKDLQSVIEYCMKEGDYIMDGIELFKNSKGFKRRMADHEAWCRYTEAKHQQPVTWPITLPDGTEAKQTTDKQRHWWIVGAPNKGKTTWAKETFRDQQVYWRSNNKYPYEGYNGEEVIIIDDFFPKFEELADVCEIWFNYHHVYGDSRNNGKYWKKNQARTVFILSNEEPNYFKHQEAFEARFNILKLE